MKLSVIIPMYNAEKYIKRCIESVYHQDLDINDFELLVINDGSTDSSPSIVKELQKIYPNILLINKENGGQGSARNLGIDSSCGEYIMFIDADDYLSEDQFLSKLLNNAVADKVDIIEFEMLVFSKDGNSQVSSKNLKENIIYTGEQLLLLGLSPGSSCDKLFSRFFLVSNSFSFKMGIIHEDVEFLFRVYPTAKRIKYSHICGYVYYYNTNSTDRSLDFHKIKRGIDSDFYIVHELMCLSMDSYSPELKEYYKKQSNSLLCSLLLSFLWNRRYIPLQDIKKYLLSCRVWSIYPIRGKTMSKKSDCLLPLFNIEVCYLFLNKILRIFRY